ncbi:thioredoxin family protein [Amphritea balenae]|uniref:Thioredoxin-like fold domain-containing protein n=1 Tax=Amphritea balenae TaxID=452629 RepID=A0A3P1SKK1_9GAMM|nr:thioredoxin fold domain-containing protein [Amphritea balenae]RRC97811.1 hypothetical protein EHS89_16690 [Amphritea balenae]GGK83172.1 hypothetical protein GCM10007941_37150 [Amphritea balenae]
MKLPVSFVNYSMAIFWLCLSLSAQASPLPLLEDLQKDQQQAGNRFLLVLISQPDCSYCELVEEEILKPMQISGHYDQRLLFRNLIIHDGQELIDSAGNTVSATRFAHRYDSPLTPTLLFLNPANGEQLIEKMIGISTPEMYGFYVEKAVRKAHKKMLGLK